MWVWTSAASRGAYHEPRVSGLSPRSCRGLRIRTDPASAPLATTTHSRRRATASSSAHATRTAAPATSRKGRRDVGLDARCVAGANHEPRVSGLSPRSCRGLRIRSGRACERTDQSIARPRRRPAPLATTAHSRRSATASSCAHATRTAASATSRKGRRDVGLDVRRVAGAYHEPRVSGLSPRSCRGLRIRSGDCPPIERDRRSGSRDDRCVAASPRVADEHGRRALRARGSRSRPRARPAGPRGVAGHARTLSRAHATGQGPPVWRQP
jgi:hypothetical protein